MVRSGVLFLLCVLAVSAAADGVFSPSPDDPAAQLARIHEQQGIWSLDGVDPLVRLGLRAARQQSHAAAIDYFKQAQHILHRHDGVHTLAQVDLVQEMARSYLALADLETADSLMRFRHEIVTHNYGKDDVRVVPSMVELGNWFQARAEFREAIAIYRDALALLRAQNVTGRPVQRTLNLLSFTEYLQGRCCSRELVEAAVEAIMTDDESDFADRASAMRAAADMMILAGFEQRAGEMYAAAGSFVEAGQGPVWLGVSRGDRMMRAYEPFMARMDPRSSLNQESRLPPGQLVGSPLAFCESQLDQIVGRRDYRDFEIQLEFVVDDDGRARKVRVVDSNAPAAVDLLTTRVLRTSRFRPVVRDGEVVEQTVRLTQRFDAPVALSAPKSPFPPANFAVFHACHGLAQLR